jgi:hypothetical protein
MQTAIIEVKPIDAQSAIECQKKSSDLSFQAKNLEIKNQNDYEFGATLLKSVKGLAKIAESARKTITDPIDVARKAAMDLFRPVMESLESDEKIIKNKMLTYAAEQEKIRQEQERKLRIEAEEKARKERERLEERARKAAESGKAAKAEELQQAAAEVQAVAPVLAPRVEKVIGVSTKTIWKARVKDIAIVPREYMVVDESALNKVAQATKGSLNIPGVEFYSEQVLASGR